jgi:hypothetical protein
MLLRESQSWATESRGDAGDDDRGREAKLVGMSCRKADHQRYHGYNQVACGRLPMALFRHNEQGPRNECFRTGPGQLVTQLHYLR